MRKKKKILFICTGNACRSQIAEGLLRSMAPEHYEVFSAGSQPNKVHPMSIVVMQEIGIDISQHTSDPISNYLNKKIDTIITVCDNAREACPVFPSNVEKIHWSIKDPFRGWSLDSKDLVRFQEIREEIKERIIDFIELV
ncbi:MAG TPA: arsenate reductase ArsC [Woeseiaceae bacterium]|nr:arsenate reductase ArsC [Woeseiaceae bacterium]